MAPCRSCSQPVQPDALFCPYCGAPDPALPAAGLPPDPPPAAGGGSPWHDLASAAQRASADVAQRAREASGHFRERVAAAEPVHDGPLATQAARRYVEAYRTARFVVGVGRVVQVLAVGAFILAFAGFAEAGSQLGDAVGVAGIIVSFLFCALIVVAGVVVSALGQIHLATLDAAVHSSPFLDDEGRARAMQMRVAPSR